MESPKVDPATTLAGSAPTFEIVIEDAGLVPVESLPPQPATAPPTTTKRNQKRRDFEAEKSDPHRDLVQLRN
jgi:hypothetical protein